MIKDYDDFLDQQSHTSLTKLLSMNLLRCYFATVENDWSAADLYMDYVNRIKKAIEKMCGYEINVEEILKNQLDIENHKRLINFEKK